jgi:RNA polymerase sigma factor (sigma-70 family)
MTLLDPEPRPLDDPAGCSDAELIAAVRAGDRAAFAQLYERHERAARRMARQLSASPHDVDDLVAEAFARVFDMLSAGRGPDSAFRAYLLTAVRNGMYERARRDRRLELSEDMGRHDRGEPWVDPAEAELNSALAARAFASLPERWRTVLWYSEVEQESTAEVGSRLGLRPNAVAALAYRAREGLRQAFLQAHVSGCDEEACREAVARLGSWTRDRISTGDAARVEAHLATCRRCRQVAAELEEVNSGLRGLLAPLLLGGAATGPLAALLRDSAGGASTGAASAGAASAGAASAGAASAGAASAGAASAGAGAASAGAGAASAGAASAGAGAASAAVASGGTAAVAGGSVLGWLAGAHAGPAAAVLTAVVVGGTAVAAGVAVPHAVHRTPAASAVAAAGITSGGAGESVLWNTSPATAKAAAKATTKQAKAAKKAAKKAAVRAPGAHPSNPRSAAPGNGQVKPKNPQAAAPGQGQAKEQNPQAAASGQGQAKEQNPQAAASGQGQAKEQNPQAAAPGNGQAKPKNPQAAPGQGQTEATNPRAAAPQRGPTTAQQPQAAAVDNGQQAGATGHGRQTAARGNQRPGTNAADAPGRAKPETSAATVGRGQTHRAARVG